MKNIGREGSSFAKSIIYDDLQLIIQSVVEGLGIAFVSRSVVNQYLEDGRLRQHKVPGFGHTRRRSLVAAAPFNPAPPLADFISCVGAAFGMAIDLAGGQSVER
jgi:LysR family transcriptional regulator, transcriptional activator of the cysJI operon